MPFVFPQTDVAVVYVTAEASLRQTLRVSAANGLERVDAPGGGLSMITDTVHATTTLLDNAAHQYSIGPAPPGTADMRGKRAPADYARVGDAIIAGAPCTRWTTHDRSGQVMTVCLTDDGVLTEVDVAGTAVLRAASIEHAAQDPSLFTPPPSWRRTDR